MLPEAGTMRADAELSRGELPTISPVSGNVCRDNLPVWASSQIARNALADRLDARTDKSGGPAACWPVSGYGSGRDRQRVQLVVDATTRRRDYAYRIAYTLTHGPIPDGKVVMHTCDTPRCVNPAHLVLGTQADNIRDPHAKGRFTAHYRNGVRLNGQTSRRVYRRLHLSNHADVPAHEGTGVFKGFQRAGVVLSGRHTAQSEAAPVGARLTKVR